MLWAPATKYVRHNHAWPLSPSTKSSNPGTTNTRSIPYFNVLWAEVVKNDLTIRYAKPTSKSPRGPVVVAYINYTLENLTSAEEKASKWVARLLARAYGPSQRNKRIKLLINPFGGVGKAEKLYPKEIEPI